MNTTLNELQLSDEVQKAISKMKKELTMERAQAAESNILRAILGLPDKDSKEAREFRQAMRFHFGRNYYAKRRCSDIRIAREDEL